MVLMSRFGFPSVSCKLGSKVPEIIKVQTCDFHRKKKQNTKTLSNFPRKTKKMKKETISNAY